MDGPANITTLLFGNILLRVSQAVKYVLLSIPLAKLTTIALGFILSLCSLNT